MKVAWLFLCLIVVVGSDIAGRAEESRSARLSRTHSDIAINEILADPPDGEDGDSNRDGVRNTYADEFVEIYNAGADTADLRGWRIVDATGVRHVFPDSIDVLLPPGRFVTIFGGGDPTGFDGMVWVASSGRLSLNNSEDIVGLISASGDTMDVHAYGSEAGRNESLIRVPDGSGEWTRPSVEEWEWFFSPQEPNRGETGTGTPTWGQVKRQYHIHG